MLTGDPAAYIPADFQFSQSSLQDFQQCPRKFQLKYIQRCAWPALVSEPALEHERRMLQGSAFHRMVQQHLAGIPAERLSQMIPPASGGEGKDLRRWWQNYLEAGPVLSNGRRRVEYLLSTPLVHRRLAARYDLLLLVPAPGQAETLQKALILDWKTGGKRAQRSRLAAAFQTRVYRYVLARAGAVLNSGLPIRPDQIEMVYWFADEPGSPEVFSYNPDLFEQDESDLRDLIAEICSRKESEFWMAAPERQCLYCIYRSLCDRGAQAGPLEKIEGEDSPSILDGLSLDQAEEIAY